MIEEHISGEIQFYNSTAEQWETYVNGVLSDANVLSCSTKDQCCENNKFSVGGVFAGSLQLVCRLPGFSRYHLYNARIRIRSWFGNDASQSKMRGVFWAMTVAKQKDVFAIRGTDAMGWTDGLVPRSSDGHLLSRIAKVNGGTVSGGKVLDVWFQNFFTVVNSVLEDKTGISGLLSFRAYDPELNCGISYGNHYACDTWWSETETPHYFAIDFADDGFKTEKPRDILHWIAEATGGFITVDGDGRFAMRNFNMPELGIAEIYDADTEMDSFELSDYYIYPKTVRMKYVYTSFWGDAVSDSTSKTDPYDEPEFSGFDFTIDMNAVMDGSTGHFWFGSLIWGEFYAFARYEDVDVVGGVNTLIVSYNQNGLQNLQTVILPETAYGKNCVVLEGKMLSRSGVSEVVFRSDEVDIRNWQTFAYCSNLKQIEFPEVVPKDSPSIPSNTFYGCDGITITLLGNSAGSISGAPWGATNATVIWAG